MRRLLLLLLATLVIAVACGDEPTQAVADTPSVAPTAESAPALDTDLANESDATNGPPDNAGEPVADEEAEAPTEAAATVRDFSAIAPIVEANITEHELDGAGIVIVDRRDGVVHEAYWGDFGPDRVSLIASATKMITAGVLLYLDDRGVLDIDAPVIDIVDWGQANPTITPAQLLSNSSGLPGLFPDPAYGPYLCQYVAAGSLRDCGEAIFTSTADDSDVVPPDTEFRYGGGQWQVAGAVAEAASGRSWSELIEEIYVEPCDLETLEYNNHFAQLSGGFSYPEGFDGDPSVLEPTENPNMEGGVYVTPRDYAQLLLMHLRGGVCGETQVLSEAALARMHSDRIGEAYDGDGFSPDRGYGMGWWIQRDTGRIDDPGAYGAYPWLDLDDGYGVYLVVESESVIGAEIAAELADAVHEAMTGT